uniref:Uncharacterized protein n=1 Tax=Rhizophora mucronata TaxID=61149 RepID=A0A2P2QIQ0_RHIMU
MSVIFLNLSKIIKIRSGIILVCLMGKEQIDSSF